MKRILSFLLVMLLGISLVACGNNDVSEEQKTETIEPLTLLETVWGSYTEEEKFPIMGGDMNNVKDGVPGACDISDVDFLTGSLNFPADSVSMIKDAACFMHMMNANNFTCAAYRLTDGANTNALAESLKTNILATQWMCGFPEKLLILSVGDTVVAVYGLADQIDIFKGKLELAYTNVNVYTEEPIV